MGYFDVANSPLLYVLVAAGVLYIVGLSAVFLRKSWRRCLELGISKEKLSAVARSSAAFTPPLSLSSAIITPLILIIVSGVLLPVTFQPILDSGPVKIARSYMLPALHRCLFPSQMTGKAGGTVINGKLKAAVLPRSAGLSDPRVRHSGQLRHRHPGLHPPAHPVRLGSVPNGADPGNPSSTGRELVTGKENASYELSSGLSGAV